MAREELNNTEYDIAIIGGGIVGAGLFRDQALHGLKSIIIEQADFNSQTSAGSSKMLHGGIRYLENLDFGLVFEALYEKNLWLKLTPHIAKEIPFYLPVYKNSKWPLFFVRIGLFIYDVLSLFKNSPHKSFNKEKTLQKLSGLKEDGLRGSGMYFDGIVDDHKLGLECIYDGLLNKKSKALNYTKLLSFEKIADKYKLFLKDQLTGEDFVIHAKYIQFATGPFTDKAMQELNIPWKPVLFPSKGTHLWLKKKSLNLDKAMVLQTNDMRIIFVIPQRNSILVGTTEIPLKDNETILDIKPTQIEIDYLLEQVNYYFPNQKITQEDILSSFCAVRPLVRDGHNSSKISRAHKIYSPMNNIFVIVGGKYTTFRKMAQDLNKKTFKIMGLHYDKSLSTRPLKVTSVISDPYKDIVTQEKIDEICQNELVRTKDDLIKRRLSLQSIDNLEDQSMIDKLKNIQEIL